MSLSEYGLKPFYEMLILKEKNKRKRVGKKGAAISSSHLLLVQCTDLFFVVGFVCLYVYLE